MSLPQDALGPTQGGSSQPAGGGVRAGMRRPQAAHREEDMFQIPEQSAVTLLPSNHKATRPLPQVEAAVLPQCVPGDRALWDHLKPERTLPLSR